MNSIKIITSLVFFLFSYSLVFSQKKFTFYLDSSLHIVDKKSNDCAYKAKGFREGSTFRVDCFDRDIEVLRITAHFTDSLFTTPNGSFTIYNLDGSTQSKRNYSNGFKSGTWELWDKDGIKIDSSIYVNNERVAFATFVFNKLADNVASLYSLQFTDSLKNTFYQALYSKHILTSEAFFVGDRGIEKVYEDGKIKIDSVYTRDQSDPQFPGGKIGFARYVQKGLLYFNPGEKGAGNGKYLTITTFAVNTDGSVTDLKSETNFGYGMEQKAFDIIQKSPQWIPAKRFGRLAKTYQHQPVTFIVEGK